MRIRILIFLFSVLFHSPMLAKTKGLDPTKSITQYTLKSWNIDNGLPSNAISEVIQSQDGYIWIATYGGIARFDGINFTIYSKKDKDAILTEATKIICEDKEGTMWVGTQKGVMLIKDNNLYRNNKLSVLDNLYIENIFVDSNNRVWISTNASGLYIFEKDRLKRVNIIDEYTSNTISAIFEDSNNTIWLGTIKGELIKFSNNNFISYDINNSADQLMSFFEDRKGIMWVCTGNGIYTVVDKKLKKHPDLNIKFVENILEDDYGFLWIASSSEGLFRYNTKTRKTERFSELNGLPNNRVVRIVFDKQGNLWGGTYREGLFQITDGIFTCYTESEGLSSNSNTSILEYSDDEYWVANEKGKVNIIKNGTISELKTKIPIPSNNIKHLLKDRKGNVWISTYGGLLKIGISGEKLYSTNNGFPDNYIRKTLEDKEGNIWVATNRTGIHKINPKGEIISFNTDNGLTTNYVMDITLYKSDVIIAGTKKGLNFIKNDSIISQYVIEDGLPDNMVFNVYNDNDDALWIATNSGISKFINGSFYNFSVETGLTSNTVFDILEDNSGYLWMPSAKGIMKVSKNQLNDYINAKETEINCLFYDKSDGLKSSMCIGATEYLKDSKGSLWFLTSKGIAKIAPEEERKTDEFPPLFIEKVYTNDSIFDLKSTIKIKATDKRFIIDYTAIELISPEKIFFKGTLEPFEESWNELGNKRFVTYTNINPGRYVFKLSSTNNHNDWNERYISIPVEILPSWYQTILFKIGLVIAIISLILLYNTARIHRITRQKNLLEQQVRERTNEINLQKEEILTQSDELRAQRDYAQEQRQLIENQNAELEKHRNHLEKLVNERTKELEVAKSRAEESDRLKSSFLANMSHEIRTPMNAIIGFTSLLNEPTIDETTRITYRKEITNNGYSLLRLIENILDLAKIETNQIKINKKDFFVDEILKNVFEENVRKIHGDSVKFILNNDESKNISIYSDEFRIKQVLNNFIENSLKYTEKGYVELGMKLEDAFVKIYVKDTGVGMNSEQKKIIFSRFTKVEDDKKKLYRGAGLGLAICKSILTLLDSQIEVESEPNKGSTFFFKLPVKSVKDENSAKKNDLINYSAFKYPGKTIVIAEDNDSNYQFFKMILKDTEIDLKRANNGIEVVELCKVLDIDLVFMDIKMPEMDGLEATRIIKKSKPSLPIIVQTAFVLADDEKLSKEAGCDYFITKPIKQSELLSLLHKYLA